MFLKLQVIITIKHPTNKIVIDDSNFLLQKIQMIKKQYEYKILFNRYK